MAPIGRGHDERGSSAFPDGSFPFLYTRTCSNPILRYGIRRVYWHSQRRRNPGLRSGGMTAGDSIFVGKGGGGAQALLLKYANRHGLIAGATGTGKTVSLQVLAEGFSRAGVPVFLAD